MQKTIEHILDRFSSKEPIVLGTVISHEGSTPRGAGTRFVVHRDGSIFGTIGGGLLEAQVIEASTHLFESQKSIIVNYDMTQSQLNADSMVCGGKMSVLAELFEPTPGNTDLFNILQTVYQNRRESLLIINLTELENGTGLTTHAVIMNGETVFSSLQEPPPTHVSLAEIKSELRGERSITRDIEGKPCWIESLQFPEKLFLFGAGHVARATADLGVKTGFETTVVDDRASVMTRAYFSEAVKLVPIDSYDNCLESIPVDSNSFIVILTRGHKHDKMVLSQVLRLDSAYIGMIGSRKKRNTIYNHLLNEGFSQNELGRVYCPVGLKIGADTPDEIAISILAELIKVRASKK